MLEEIYEQQSLENNIQKICFSGNGFWNNLDIEEFTLKENLEDETAWVSFNLKTSNGHRNNKNDNEAVVPIESTGQGMIDALFNGMIKHLSKEYISLVGFKFKKFFVKAKINAHTSSESGCIAHLEILNSRNKLYTFTAESFSMNSSAILVVKKAMEFFVNAELAIIKIYRFLKMAQQRGRQDLVIKYTDDLAELVKVTCYSEVLKQEKELKWNQN